MCIRDRSPRTTGSSCTALARSAGTGRSLARCRTTRAAGGCRGVGTCWTRGGATRARASCRR
eukprot:5303425-Alexandrium_andersonii.AAC.1